MNKSLTLLTATILLCACVEGPDPVDDGGSIVRSAHLYTVDPNNDGLLSSGELTEPDPTFEVKPICSQDVNLEWTACLVEEDEYGMSIVFTDVNGNDICGDFVTLLECTNYRLSQGPSECLGVKYDYCQVLINPPADPMFCGWRITELVATNAVTGEVLEQFNKDFIDGLGFDLLPVPPQ